MAFLVLWIFYQKSKINLVFQLIFVHLHKQSQKLSNMLRIKEAIAYANKERKINKGDLAQSIWTKSSRKSALMNLGNLANGKNKSIPVYVANKLCDELGVSADFLFGRASEPTYDQEMKAKRRELSEGAEVISTAFADLKDIINSL